MRVLSLATLGLISYLQLAAAQDLTTLPTCALTCALNAIGATGCAATDAACICSATSFLTSVQTCIGTACSAADQAATLAFAQQFCLTGNVTITLPTGAAPAPTSTASASLLSSSAPASASAAATTASASVAGPASATSPGAPPSTFTGAANALQQQWGVLGLLGLGVAAVI